MPSKKKSLRPPYPYLIPPFSGDPSRIRKTLPEWVNEYFLIEALLRSQPVMEAYRPDNPSALIAKLRACGITGHDPLNGTHHALLSEPLEDHEWAKKLYPLGYVDNSLGILDLGVLAKLPPNQTARYHDTIVAGSGDGMGDCRSYLLGTNPRYVCLRIDAAKPVETILQRLRVFLKDRHTEATQRPLLQEASRRLQRTPFRNIPAWLAYVRCYDLYQSGLTIEAAGAQVYGGSAIATEKANVAIRRVTSVIRHAVRVATEQERGSKQRIKRPTPNRPFWPPHHIP